MAAGSIIIDLLMRTGAFETDTKRAERRLRELKKEAEKVGAAIGVAFAAVGTAAAYMVKSSIDAMDEMSKAAQKVGTSVESLSALSYAANLAGVSQESLNSAMVKLSKNMSDAAMGTGEAEKGFAALGLSVKNADGSLKTSDQMLAAVAQKFAGFKDGAEKTALAVNLFGKAGAELIPLLNGGSAGLEALREEAKRLGIVLDTETAKSAEEFNDNLTRMGAAVRGVANRAAGELLPVMTEVSQMFVDLAKNETAVEVATDLVKAAIGGMVNLFQTVAVLGSDVGFVFLTMGRSIGAVAAAAAAVTRGDFKGVGVIFDELSNDSARARAELDKFQARIMSLGTGSGGLDDEARRRLGRGPSPTRRNAPRLQAEGKKGPDPDADFRRYLDGLQQQVQKTHELTAVEKVLDDIRRGSLTVNDKQKEQLLVLAQTIDREKELTEQLKLKREASIADGVAVIKANEAYQDLMKRMLDSGPAAQLERQRKEMMMLADAMKAGAITADQFQDAATGWLGLNKAIKETDDVAKDFGRSFSVALEAVIVRGEKLSGVLKSLALNVANIALHKAVISPLGDMAGNWLSRLFGGPRAEGGPVSAGTTYLVGERGPELFTPSRGGQIIPNGAGGGQTTVINNFTVGDVASMSKVREAIAASQRATAGSLMRSRQYGGAFA